MFLGEVSLISMISSAADILAGYGLSYGLARVLTGFIQPEQQSTLLQNFDMHPLIITRVSMLKWTIAASVFAE